MNETTSSLQAITEESMTSYGSMTESEPDERENKCFNGNSDHEEDVNFDDWPHEVVPIPSRRWYRNPWCWVKILAGTIFLTAFTVGIVATVDSLTSSDGDGDGYRPPADVPPRNVSITL